MSLPRTITEAPTVPVPTGAHADESERSRPLIQFRVARVSGASPQQTSELKTQLRKRLRFCALVVLVYCAVEIGIFVPFAYQHFLSEPLGAFAQSPHGLLFLIAYWEGVLVARLAPHRRTDFAQLRILEWLVMTPVIVYSAWGSTITLAGSWQGIVTQPVVFAFAGTNPWGLIAVAYGVLIPNTWRRCAAMVGLILLVGYFPGVSMILLHGIAGAPAFLYLATKTLWFGVAGAIAVYGSYRIESLRKEAFDARKLGQYLLKDRLGAGGMGEVYLAEHVLLRRPCAIKLIRPERAGDPANLLRFEREVRTTATLTHPNTVQIYDYGRADDGAFYYVMEYLPGLTLAELVEQYGPLPPARAVHLLRQVCEALAEAHAIGLIHRDIKPSNVIVCDRGGFHDVVKLLDFGLVLDHEVGPDGERLTQEGALTGTPAYMSPEQAAGGGSLEVRSDIYSMGCLAYFLLTGQSPFAGRSTVRMLAAHLYEPPAPLTPRSSEVTEELQAVVLRCLAKEPAERFPSARDLERALAACPLARTWTEEDAEHWWQVHRLSTRQPNAGD